MWSTLLSNATSLRTNVYYGTNQAGKGPAVRDTEGYKLILSDSGGGQGAWSGEQYPNATHSSSSSSSFSSPSFRIGNGISAYARAGQCSMQTGTCYPGADISPMNSTDPATCCVLCGAHPECVGFTWRNNPKGDPNCFLKSKMNDGQKGSCTSGFAPGGQPPPTGPLLYNVVSDAGEHTVLDPTAPQNAAVVARLQKVVADYAKTKVPQATGDPACPQFSGINTTNPITGETAKYIGPWCDGY